MALDTTFDEVIEMNVEKLESRYPGSFDVHKSENRKEGDLWMDAAVEAWNTMGWFEGFLFTAWLVAFMWANLRLINGSLVAPYIVLNWRMENELQH